MPDRVRSTNERPVCPEFGIRSYLLMTVLLALSLLQMSLIFQPRGQWYLAYVCMVPWLVVVSVTVTARRVYVASWLLGLAFFLINMWWMEAPTGMGYVLLSACLALYFPLAACPLRHVVRRRYVPLSLVFPIVWVATEYLRGLLLSGFPWFFLAHSHARVLSMIQISDLVGAYGLSFVLAAVNGATADGLFALIGRSGPTGTRRRRRAYASVGFATLIVIATYAYGRYQLSRDTIQPGPRVALLQNSYPNFTDREKAATQPSPPDKAQAYFAMMAKARNEQPDLYLFPETAWVGMFLNREFREADPSIFDSAWFRYAHRNTHVYFDAFRDWAQATGASIVVGSASLLPTSLSLRASETFFNSAYHFASGAEEPERHDKIHPVLFGETVPFRYGRLRFLYLWLNSLSPFGQNGFEYSLMPGDDVRAFTMTTRGPVPKTYHFGVPICYEDVMPYVCRRFVWDVEEKKKRVDFLLNISNDGWFLYRNEQQQHFAICTFRAVENRVGIARTVNTGISGFIDPDGRMHDTIDVGKSGYRVARVATDSRISLYSRTGDVFALVCALLSIIAFADYVVVRMVTRNDESGGFDAS